jgi:hypothetical protein
VAAAARVNRELKMGISSWMDCRVVGRVFGRKEKHKRGNVREVHSRYTYVYRSRICVGVGLVVL